VCPLVFIYTNFAHCNDNNWFEPPFRRCSTMTSSTFFKRSASAPSALRISLFCRAATTAAPTSSYSVFSDFIFSTESRASFPRRVAAQNGLHAERFTRRTVYTHRTLYTRRTVYTQNGLHTERFTHRTGLHTERVYTQHGLHAERNGLHTERNGLHTLRSTAVTPPHLAAACTRTALASSRTAVAGSALIITPTWFSQRSGAS
jgi:hypothetical protein